MTLNNTVFKSTEGGRQIKDFTDRVYRQWPAAYEKLEINAEGYKTNVMVSGPAEGTPVVLLHGTGTNSASWMGDIARLSRGYRVYAVDIPGEPGLSDSRRIPLARTELEAWSLGLIKGLGLQQAHFIGMSLGGYYALRTGAARPETVKSLTLLAPSGVFPARISFIFKALPLTFLGNYGLHRLNRIVSPGVNIPEAMFDFGRLCAKHFRPMNEPVPLLSDEALSSLLMPLLYFGGTEDALLNTGKSAARIKKLVPRADVRVLQKTGHTVLGKTEEILEFIEKSD